MRRRKARLLSSLLRTARTLPLTRSGALFLAICVASTWMGWSLLHELALSHQLTAQATQLRQQNAATQSTNQRYGRDIAAASSGASAEEDARQDGYARPKEKVFIVSGVAPVGPDSGAAPSGQTNPLAGFWRWFSGSSG